MTWHRTGGRPFVWSSGKIRLCPWALGKNKALFETWNKANEKWGIGILRNKTIYVSIHVNMYINKIHYGPLTNCGLRMRRECREMFAPSPTTEELASKGGFRRGAPGAPPLKIFQIRFLSQYCMSKEVWEAWYIAYCILKKRIWDIYTVTIAFLIYLYNTPPPPPSPPPFFQIHLYHP